MNTPKTLVAACLFFCVSTAQAQTPDAFEQNRHIGRGVNILGYDPIWRSRDQARFQAHHFQLLKQAGFDSVRVNLHAFRHMGPAPDYVLSPAWFATLDWVLDEAANNNLYVILDFHEFNTMGKDPEANKAKFLAFWSQVAEHCRTTPPSVVFEILNEPNSKLTPALWNTYLQQALSIIRQQNPTRTVIVGPAFWNNINHLEELELPADDPNLIVTVHYYSPFEFTHQGASWTEHKDKSGITWDGTDPQRTAIRSDFEKAAAWAKQHNRPFFVGEFGAFDKAPMDSRARWTDAVTRTIESLGGSWAYWQFDSDFILYDIPHNTWITPIRDALIPSP